MYFSIYISTVYIYQAHIHTYICGKFGASIVAESEALACWRGCSRDNACLKVVGVGVGGFRS